MLVESPQSRWCVFLSREVLRLPAGLNGLKKDQVEKEDFEELRRDLRAGERCSIRVKVDVSSRGDLNVTGVCGLGFDCGPAGGGPGYCRVNRYVIDPVGLTVRSSGANEEGAGTHLTFQLH